MKLSNNSWKHISQPQTRPLSIILPKRKLNPVIKLHLTWSHQTKNKRYQIIPTVLIQSFLYIYIHSVDHFYYTRPYILLIIIYYRSLLYEFKNPILFERTNFLKMTSLTKLQVNNFLRDKMWFTVNLLKMIQMQGIFQLTKTVFWLSKPTRTHSYMTGNWYLVSNALKFCRRDFHNYFWLWEYAIDLEDME